MIKNPIFLDCGFFEGNALKIYHKRGIVDSSWEIYAWEPNPDVNVGAKIPEELLNELKIQINREAVGTYNGEATLQIAPPRTDSASILGTAGHSNPRLVKVKTFDFSEYVAKLPDTMIICSMDIEGSEYKVLEKMLKERTIDKITILDIEFHDRLMSEKSEDDSKALLYELAKYTAVRLKGWT